MKTRTWVRPNVAFNTFEANEYVSACEYQLEDGTILYSDGVVARHTAYSRTPAGNPGLISDDEITPNGTIYMGSFYRIVDGQKVPDSTQFGHEEFEDWGTKTCVRGGAAGDNEDDGSKSPWGYHYHFTSVRNQS